MSRKSTLIGGHVEVYLRNPGDFGMVRFSGDRRSEREVEKDLNTLERAINTRLNKYDDEFGGSRIVMEYDHTCEHCGYPWTEDDPNYNGGCCDQDESNNPDPTCPQCHGPVHESGFCPSCKEATVA